MTATEKRERMYARIRQHGENLLRIFPHATERDPVELCKKLRRLESKGNAIGLRLCNGPQYREGEDEKTTDAILASVNRLLGNINGSVPVFVNLDPRGYALKIRDEYVRQNGLVIHTDWGGYGILAPDLSE